MAASGLCRRGRTKARDGGLGLSARPGRRTGVSGRDWASGRAGRRRSSALWDSKTIAGAATRRSVRRNSGRGCGARRARPIGSLWAGLELRRFQQGMNDFVTKVRVRWTEKIRCLEERQVDRCTRIEEWRAIGWRREPGQDPFLSPFLPPPTAHSTRLPVWLPVFYQLPVW